MQTRLYTPFRSVEQRGRPDQDRPELHPTLHAETKPRRLVFDPLARPHLVLLPRKVPKRLVSPSEPAPNVSELQWVSQSDVDDEWSGFSE